MTKCIFCYQGFAVRLVIAFLSHLVLMPAVVGAPQADGILGLYWNPDRDRIVEIYAHDDGSVCGRVGWSATVPIDTANPVQSLRGRNLLGCLS